MLPGSPLIIYAVAATLALPATYAVMKVKGDLAAAAGAKLAYQQGYDAGKGLSATNTLVEANKTAEARREAEAETPLPIDKQAINELCRRRPKSCREAPSLK